MTYLYKEYDGKNGTGAMTTAKNKVFIELKHENSYLGGWGVEWIFGRAIKGWREESTGGTFLVRGISNFCPVRERLDHST